MFLGQYAFDGDPVALAAAYRTLLANFPPDSLDLRVTLARAEGLLVYDACPDEQTFRAFSVSGEFRAALSAAGLPAPRVAGLGEVVHASLKQPVG
jgi:hypothetical protein